jgi:hypothetical protein
LIHGDIGQGQEGVDVETAVETIGAQGRSDTLPGALTTVRE